MMKYVFVTGGVVSSLGKGTTAASLGRLLKARGYKVAMQKCDTYYNFNPALLSPLQHGENFITEDGVAADLDLGHYERFIDESLKGEASISEMPVEYAENFTPEYNPVVCEELGFVGAVVVILLFILLIVRGYYIAMHARDRFGALLAAGISTHFALQTFLNIGVVTNFLPATGISLPFFSYGGTALLMQLFEAGIVLAVSRQNDNKLL